jgi:hypothetical protein
VSPGVWTWERCLGLGDGWSWVPRWYNECGWRANCTARRRTSRPPRGHGGQKGTIRGNVNGGADETVCLSMRASCGTGVAVVLTRALVLASNAQQRLPGNGDAVDDAGHVDNVQDRAGLGWAGSGPAAAWSRYLSICAAVYLGSLSHATAATSRLCDCDSLVNASS